MKKGFTLIELLIVIAILGILVALILPRFPEMRRSAQENTCEANLRGLTSAMVVYTVQEDKDDISWDLYSPTDLNTWEYLAASPSCPGTGTYTLSGTGGQGSADCSEPTHSI